MLPLVMGTAAVAVALRLASQQPGSSLSTLGQQLTGFAGATIRLTEQQSNMVAIIRGMFVDAKLGFMWRAAAANAYAESLLDPDAAGDGGLSIGLFQLHARGAGTGMSVEERSNPRSNTERIIQTAIDAGARRFASPTIPTRSVATNAQLVRWFAADVENCAKCGGSAAARLTGGDSSEWPRRERIFERMFPDVGLFSLGSES